MSKAGVGGRIPGGLVLVIVFAAALRLLLLFLSLGGVIPPLIDVRYYDAQAVAALLSGTNPYGHLYVGIPSWLATAGAERVFAYLPGVVLFLAPFGGLFDTSLGLILADFVIAWSLFSLGGVGSRRASVAFLLAPWAPLFSTIYPNNTLVAMAFLGLCLLWEAKGKSLLSSLSLGASLASSQLVWLIYPFFLVHYLRERRLRDILASALVAAMLFLPFLLWNPGSFLYDTVTFQFTRPADTLIKSEAFGFNVNPTLSGIAQFAFGVSVPLFLKLGLALVLLLFFLYRTRSWRGLPLNASLFLLAAMLVLPDDFSWWYLELPFQMLLVAYVLNRGGRAPAPVNA
jgi:hypothetical protein